MSDRLQARVEGARDEVTALCRDLVRIPSENPPGRAYRACVELVGERLRRRGFDVHYLRAEGALADSDRYPRWNVVARLESGRPGPTVHFNSHIDVVAPGHGWTRDPWGGEVDAGRIYGRGTCDMKGGLASSMVAVEALLDEGLLTQGAVEVSATADEESGGQAGVMWLAERGWFSPARVDHVVIPEPFNRELVCLGHRGVWWAELETKGHIAHGSMPFQGDCAIRHMAAVLDAFERELWPALAARRTAVPVIPEGARNATLNVAAIHGGMPEVIDGLPTPLVADRCRLTLDRRYLLEETKGVVAAEISTLLDRLRATRPGFDYDLRETMHVPPTTNHAEAATPQAFATAIGEVYGKPARFVASPGTYDQKHVHHVGGVTDCIAYGPGHLHLAHQPDEYVEIDDLVGAAQVMAVATTKLLHGR
ncbi:MAG: acetylornithine deacetylase/succinyl-diaminopimelate desuccinylase family protein [Geminicoccaceae bacterium]|nr:MAG: acetylornithine deacetylase/succinyl-diaminopimelate desuccinylase family protein [Geminicoccaceae bacterium]